MVATVQGFLSESHREQIRVRSFRNVILGVTLVITVVAFIVAIVAFVQPSTFPLCFAPEASGQAIVVCPLDSSGPLPLYGEGSSPQADIDDALQETINPVDVAVVEFLGTLGATIAAATSLQSIRSSADPFSLGVALALFKLPTGAVTAFLGILLIRAAVVPGLTALDSSAQIIAWAIALGYSQQLFTRFVDRQGQAVLQQADKVSMTSPRIG